MANIISDETIEYVGILAKLDLSGEEREQAKKVSYVPKLENLPIHGNKDTVILTDCSEEDLSLQGMIKDFQEIGRAHV